MKILIVYAHHEAQSFNAALLARSVEVLTACGHEVRISDLYATGFNPVATADDFRARRFPDRLQYDREQKHNYQSGGLSDEVRRDQQPFAVQVPRVLDVEEEHRSALRGDVDQARVQLLADGAADPLEELRAGRFVNIGRTMRFPSRAPFGIGAMGVLTLLRGGLDVVNAVHERMSRTLRGRR